MKSLQYFQFLAMLFAKVVSILISSICMKTKEESIVLEFPMRIKYENEKAWDGGGMSRDALSQFWDESYTILFDGGNLLTPVITPQSDLSSILGHILSWTSSNRSSPCMHSISVSSW